MLLVTLLLSNKKGLSCFENPICPQKSKHSSFRHKSASEFPTFLLYRSAICNISIRRVTRSSKDRKIKQFKKLLILARRSRVPKFYCRNTHTNVLTARRPQLLAVTIISSAISYNHSMYDISWACLDPFGMNYTLVSFPIFVCRSSSGAGICRWASEMHLACWSHTSSKWAAHPSKNPHDAVEE